MLSTDHIEDVYEEVDEQEYKRRVQSRQAQDDFIVDDDGDFDGFGQILMASIEESTLIAGTKTMAARSSTTMMNSSRERAPPLVAVCVCRSCSRLACSLLFKPSALRGLPRRKVRSRRQRRRKSAISSLAAANRAWELQSSACLR